MGTNLAALSRSARVAAMRARALRPLPPRPLAEQLFKAADQSRQGYTLGRFCRSFSEQCRFMQRMALTRAYAALAMFRETGWPAWRKWARDAIHDAGYWRRAAADAARRGR